MQLLNNNGLMLGTGATARRRARQNNAYRLGGATNANRLRRAQQMGQRMNGGGNNLQRNNNNNNVIGGVSRDYTHFLIFLKYSCHLLIGKRSIFNFLVIGQLKVQINPQNKLAGHQQQPQQQRGSESEQQQSLGLGKQQPEIELVVAQ